MRFVAFMAICLPAFCLAGCSGEPSVDDIQTALQARQNKSRAGLNIQISDVKKHSCTALDDGRYRCAVSATGNSGSFASERDLSLLMQEMGDHWIILKE